MLISNTGYIKRTVSLARRKFLITFCLEEENSLKRSSTERKDTSEGNETIANFAIGFTCFVSRDSEGKSRGRKGETLCVGAYKVRGFLAGFQYSETVRKRAFHRFCEGSLTLRSML